MTAAQYELAVLILKGMFLAGEYLVEASARLNLVGGMTDEQCLSGIPIVKQNINENSDIINRL